MSTDNNQDENLTHVRFNPLADYELQTAYKPKRVKKKIGDTTLADDIRLPLWGMTDDSDIGFRDEYGNFKFAQVIDQPGNRNRILSMSSSAHSLFIWILFKLDYRSDTVEMRREDVVATGLKISTNTFSRAIKELEEKGIIKRIGAFRTKEYWLFNINPQIMWKGEAKKFYKDVLKAHPGYKQQSTNPKANRSRKSKAKSKRG